MALPKDVDSRDRPGHDDPGAAQAAPAGFLPFNGFPSSQP